MAASPQAPPPPLRAAVASAPRAAASHFRAACTASIALATTLAVAPATRAQAPGLDADPRMQRPPLPTSLDEVVTRFLPLWEPLGDSHAFTLDQGAQTSFALNTVAGHCYAAVGHANDIADLDIRVRVDGAIIAQDVLFDSYPVVRWCAAVDATVEAEARAFSGAGAATLRFYADPNAADRTAGELDELSNRLSHQITRTAPRWQPLGPQWRRSFRAAGMGDLTIDAEPDACYTVVAVGQASIVDLDLRLVDADGVERALDIRDDPTAVVTHCPEFAGRLAVDVAVTLGHGAVAAQVLTHPR